MMTTSTTFLLSCLLACLISLVGSSIDIKTLPPDLRRLRLSPSSSFLAPAGGGTLDSGGGVNTAAAADWSGDHSAVLDGDQGKVSLSWSIKDQFIYFKVRLVKEEESFRTAPNLKHPTKSAPRSDGRPASQVYSP